MSLLVVSEEGKSFPELEIEGHRKLEYRFTSDFPDDGFAGWERESREGVTSIDVAEFCRGSEFPFRSQALNRFLAQAVLREKPSAIVVCGVWGCTVDLPRIGKMMGVPTVFVVSGWSRPARSYDDAVQAWLRNAMECCHYTCGEVEEFWDGCDSTGLESARRVGMDDLARQLTELITREPPTFQFNYSTYEFVSRDHPYLSSAQQPDTGHFAGLDCVLDVGCGAGIFLDCLRREGISGQGVESDPVVAEYGRGLGLDILTGDALAFLEASERQFDGIYCSHFVEHLPIKAVHKLIALLFASVRQGGIVVLAFPDPESIRSQLLGFWRDPEHVRFYHPELVASLAMAAGFVMEWSSYEQQPHNVVPFKVEPPGMPALATLERPVWYEPRRGWLAAVLHKLGWKSSRSVSLMQEQWEAWASSVCEAFHRQQLYVKQLTERSDTLWRVNQTWAWNDTVTIRLRKGK